MTAETSHPPVENWDSFMARFEPWKEFMPGEDFETAMALTDAAYGMGKIRPPQVAFRLTGERYFEHLRGVALILMMNVILISPGIYQ